MDALALVEAPEHVCCRYRIRAFKDALERSGHRLHIEALATDIRARWRQLATSRDHDAVLLQRKLPHPLELIWLRRHARRLVFDFDDAVFARDSYSPRGSHSRKRSTRFAALMKCVDQVLAGNEFLLARAIGAGADPDRVAFLPTCVETRAYPVARHDRGPADGMRLVWIGSSSTLQGIERERSMWDRLGRKFPGLSMRVICDRFPALGALPIEPIPWSEATESDELARGDVGVAWVPDDLWSHGKCGLKVIQYLAAGLPVLANPVGVHSEMIESEHNGFLVHDESRWEEAIDRLFHDPRLRARMGAAARASAEARYSVQGWSSRWIDAVFGAPTGDPGLSESARVWRSGRAETAAAKAGAWHLARPRELPPKGVRPA